ncbi:MAG: M16 family metallopeptidase [Prochlorothrix sp.]
MKSCVKFRQSRWQCFDRSRLQLQSQSRCRSHSRSVWNGVWDRLWNLVGNLVGNFALSLVLGIGLNISLALVDCQPAASAPRSAPDLGYVRLDPDVGRDLDRGLGRDLGGVSRPELTVAELPPPLHYTDLTFPPLPEITLPKYERRELANGLVVYLVEDHELPLVQGRAVLRVGDRWEPAAKAGLGSLTGQLMRGGGTQHRSFEDINKFLEDRAASIETSIGTTAGQASFSALTEELEPVLALFAEILREPAFAPDRLDLAKRKIAAGIARRNDDPSSITSREFQKLLYGADSPYAWTVELDTVAAIDRADLVNFYHTYIQPDRLILGISGDFDSATLWSQLEQRFGDWQSTAQPLPPLPPVQARNPGQLFTVDQPQMTQSYVQLGQLGGRLDSPDYPALSVLNEVLNGFGGRLYNEVRSRQGLAYSVYSYWRPNYDFPGTFVAGGQTRTETTLPFLRSVRAEITALQDSLTTPEELQFAKDVVLNSFVFGFQSPGQTLGRLMTYEYYGYPADFIFQYQRSIAAVTRADVQRAAQVYLDPERWVTLVVGDVESIADDLQMWGTPQAIDITIPQP